MPIYEYRCTACEKDHEIIQKVSEGLLKICPACGGRLEKKLSLSGFQLKGGGWYKEGYASSKPEKKSETKPETKKETKPEAKPEKKPEVK